MNDCNLELLNTAYQNTSMAIESIDNLENSVENERFLNLIRSQKTEYIKFNDFSCEKIRKYGKEPQEINMLAKISSKIGMTTETFIDNSVSKLAQMMIEGTNMGVISIKKELNTNNCADNDVRKFCDELMTFEENSINSLKDFL